jgi:putative transposase
MSYNPLIHHRRSIRLPGYDYSSAGAYFITILTKHREHLFGEIQNGEMILNEIGQIAHNEWVKTQELRPNIELDEFVIMPNHIHGIVIIKDEPKVSEIISTSVRAVCDRPIDTNIDTNVDPTVRAVCDCPIDANVVIDKPATERAVCDHRIDLFLDSNKEPIVDSPFTKPKSLISKIVSGYKSSVTSIVNNKRDDKSSIWHRNYHEHIIKNHDSCMNISNYIILNPQNFQIDKYFL